jgi:hypothetical protein
MMATANIRIPHLTVCTQVRFVAPASMESDEFGRTFTIMTLLTGSAREAEAAMLDAIGRMCPGRVSKKELFLACAKAAIASRRAPEASPDTEDASAFFPRELKRILLLPGNLRHCFVLRLLAGLSGEECERLNILNVEESTCAAVEELARICSSE